MHKMHKIFISINIELKTNIIFLSLLDSQNGSHLIQI